MSIKTKNKKKKKEKKKRRESGFCVGDPKKNLIFSGLIVIHTMVYGCIPFDKIVFLPRASGYLRFLLLCLVFFVHKFFQLFLLFLFSSLP
jgi:hypothetical protein